MYDLKNIENKINAKGFVSYGQNIMATSLRSFFSQALKQKIRQK